MTHMVGSYAPKEEVQFYTTPIEDAPSGLIARGHYTVKSLFTDDDNNEHLKWEWSFNIKKDWNNWGKYEWHVVGLWEHIQVYFLWRMVHSQEIDKFFFMKCWFIRLTNYKYVSGRVVGSLMLPVHIYDAI